jgi:hypothetical protein
MKKLLLILGILIVSFLATYFSVHYERSYTAVAGTECEPGPENPRGLCYGEFPAGGFPLAYLYDDPCCSVPGIHFIEDDFKALPFLIDFACYAAGITLLIYFLRKKYVKPTL